MIQHSTSNTLTTNGFKNTLTSVESVIACLDSPNHVTAVLDASMWAASRLDSRIGLLHASPKITDEAQLLDYGAFYALVEEQTQATALQQPTHLEMTDKGATEHLLKSAEIYCKYHYHYHKHKQPISLLPLYRSYNWLDSLSAMQKMASLMVIGHDVTCKTTLSQLIRPCHCPILVTPAPFSTPHSALFAFDNRPTCHRLLDWICQSPLVRTLDIHIVMIAEESDENLDALREAYARIKQSGIHCKKAMINARDVTAALLYYQQKHQLDMLMSGAFGQSRFIEFFKGSETKKLLDSTKTPYLLFPKE